MMIDHSTIRFSPSLMCANLGFLHNEIQSLQQAGVDAFHLDIMDGEFVPNFALSWHDVAAIRPLTSKPLEVHLMVSNLALHLPYAFKNKVEVIYIHYEYGNIKPYIQQIKAQGIQVGLVVNPETALSDFYTYLPMIDRLMVMRVVPGFAGGAPIAKVDDKLKALTQMQERTFSIGLDGAVSSEVIKKWAAQGVKDFVLGTASGLFGPKRNNRSYQTIIDELRMVLDNNH